MSYAAQPYRIETAFELAEHLDLSFPAAVAMARRGITSVEQAEAFLAADESYEPSEFNGIDAIVDLVLGSIDSGRRITVYGDFDADGVSATSVMVGVLRELGADADWFIPERASEGYGLNPDAIRTLHQRGTGLIISVDCGVTAVEEVALATSLGMEIVITDHHQPGEALPDCPILHPMVCDYPFKELCGTAVAAKLASALRRARGLPESADEKDLDLVALATVTDIMPLVGENRRLVKEGVKVASRAQRVGMRALMAAAKITPANLSAEDFGFRIGPRINAAGRMYRADAGVELFLATDEARAEAIGEELGRANLERRRVEREVGTAAEAARRELEDPHPAALVVAGEGWHPGVVGIVAATLSRRHNVPAVVIAIDGDSARGSARGVPGLDLYRAISDSSGHLRGFGGHTAAAGLQIDPANIDAFRNDLVAAVTDQIGTDPVKLPESFDVVLGGSDIGLELAEEFDRLAPFGKENPPISVLVPGSKITDVREMGEGKHARFTLETGPHRASVISFNRTTFGLEDGEAGDILASLGINHWNGSIEPRLQLLDLWPQPACEPGDLDVSSCEASEWWERFAEAYDTGLPAAAGATTPSAGTAVDASADATTPSASAAALSAGAETRTRYTGRGVPLAEVAEVISSGARVLVLTADAPRRWRSLGGADCLTRFRSDATAAVAWPGSAKSIYRANGELDEADVVLTDWTSLEMNPGLPATFDVVAIHDPAPSANVDALANQGSGLRIDMFGDAERDFAIAAADYRLGIKAPLRELYRGLSAAGTASGQALLDLLSGTGEAPVSPSDAGQMVKVLVEAGLASLSGENDARELSIVSSVKTDLAISPTFTASEALREETISFLRQSKR